MAGLNVEAEKLNVSSHLAQRLVSSWLDQPPDEEEVDTKNIILEGKEGKEKQKKDPSSISKNNKKSLSTASSKQDVQNLIRPARLGLGAEYLSHQQAQKIKSEIFETQLKQQITKSKQRSAAADESIEAKKISLKRPRKEAAEEVDSEDSSSDEEDSRIKALKKTSVKLETIIPLDSGEEKKSKKKKKKKKKQKVSTDLNSNNLHNSKKDTDEEGFTSNWDDTIARNDEDPLEESAATPKKLTLPPISETISSNPLLKGIVKETDAPEKKTEDATQRPRKRTKTRSRQKNLRKDTRPTHKKPTYLTPGSKDYIELRPGRDRPARNAFAKQKDNNSDNIEDSS